MLGQLQCKGKAAKKVERFVDHRAGAYSCRAHAEYGII